MCSLSSSPEEGLLNSLFIPPFLPIAALGGGPGGPIRLFVVQVAVILLTARLLARVVERKFHLPGILGELLAGILIGPFVLGSLPIPGIGPLFARGAEGASVSPELLGIATLGSLVLLFFSGLETDLRMFLRYSKAGSLVGLGGVLVSFFAGAACGPLLRLCDTWTHPTALFLGAVSTATSVGITARILSEKKKTSSPEGVTILAAAVLDDVLGILILAIVLAMSTLFMAGDSVRWIGLVGLGVKVILLWLLFTAAGIAGSRRLARGLRFLGTTEGIAIFSLGLAFLLAGVMEALGLAMIIGAFIMGLSLSNTDLAHVVRGHLQGAHDVLVPIFFCVMGMMIDFPSMKGFLLPGLVYTAVCVASKLIGCYLPARGAQFNHRGALRIGLGMIPRGEVALVIASIGLASGAVSKEVFSVAVIMTVLTTLLTPAAIARAFHGGSGVREGRVREENLELIRLDLPGEDLAGLIAERLAQAFRNEEFFVSLMERSPLVYQIRKEKIVFTLRVEGLSVLLTSDRQYTHIARFILLEEVLLFKTLSADLQKISDSRTMGDRIAGDLFS
jgi:Kef-type K+ transport system membrane component KefB